MKLTELRAWLVRVQGHCGDSTGTTFSQHLACVDDVIAQIAELETDLAVHVACYNEAKRREKQLQVELEKVLNLLKGEESNEA